MLHVFHEIPVKNLARILGESNFLTNLDIRFGEFLVASSRSDGQGTVVQTPEPTSGKSKKRKRSSRVDASVDHTPSDGPHVVEFICAVVGRCVDIVNEHDEVPSGLMKLALALPAQHAASLIGQLFSSITTIVSQRQPGTSDDGWLQSLQAVLKLWDYRAWEASSISKEEHDQAFTDKCLKPCLAFLQSTQNPEIGLVKQIERLIALHSVLPVRNKFFTDGAGALQPILASNPAIVFDIAVRSTVRNTLRRRQHEQTWLDALFSALAGKNNDGLQALLQIAINRRIALSKDALGDVVKRQLDSPDPWSSLAKVAQVDASVFLTEPMPQSLCERIAESQNVPLPSIRDGIIIPLMQAAASTRELASFVRTWHKWLTKAISIQIDDPSATESLQVWSDQEVSATFTDLSRTALTPASVRSLLRDSLEPVANMTGAENAEGLAWLAIIDCIVLSRASDCASEAGILRKILDTVVSSMDEEGFAQRWRLWRFIRRVLTILPDAEEPASILTLKASGDHTAYMSLEYSPDSKDPLESIECFHLLVTRTILRPATHQPRLQSEIDHLAPTLRASASSQSGLADACVAIILQNTEVLLTVLTEKLWPALWQYAIASESFSSKPLFEALVTSETVASNSNLLNQAFKAVHESVVGGGYRSHYAYKILLSMPVKNIKKSREQAGAIKLLEDAGITLAYNNAITRLSSGGNDSKSELYDKYRSLVASGESIVPPGASLATLESLSNPDSFEQFCLSLDYIKISLDRNPAAVNQWTVDDLVSTLALLTSPQASTISMPANGPAAIYQRLCILAGALLSRFRTRLGGRYHLFLPAIQGLLRCLFQPIPIPTSSKQPQIHRSQPHWLHSQKSLEPLDVRSATQFTRLLTSLCDPTASAVRSKTKNSELVDETKKAKSISGQYMQYVIMEYARCQLQGQLAPEVKAALMPGLYAILDVMSRELMRAMNAAMDSSSRAIFKGLYDDYTRFGKWNQN